MNVLIVLTGLLALGSAQQLGGQVYGNQLWTSQSQGYGGNNGQGWGNNQLGGQWTNGNQLQWGNNNGQQWGNQVQWGNNNGQQWGNQVQWGNNGNQVLQWGNNGLGQWGRQVNGGLGACTTQERNYLFNRCAAPFAIAHRQYWGQWRQQGICSPNTINCGVTYQFMKCMNNLPRSVVSDRCFSQATTLADWFFTNSGLNCPFTQIRSQCNQYGMNPFVNPSQRPNMGFSTNNQFGFNG